MFSSICQFIEQTNIVWKYGLVDVLNCGFYSTSSRDVVSDSIPAVYSRDEMPKSPPSLNSFIPNYSQMKSNDTQMKSNDTQMKTNDTQMKSNDTQMKTNDTQMKTNDTQMKTNDTQMKTNDTQMKTNDTQMKTNDTQMKLNDTLRFISSNELPGMDKSQNIKHHWDWSNSPMINPLFPDIWAFNGTYGDNGNRIIDGLVSDHYHDLEVLRDKKIS
jgi:hypothetical protein